LSSLPDPEIVARDLLNRACQLRPPVDLDQMSRLWTDLRISTEPLGREGYLVDLGAQGAELIVNSEDPPTRRRYTIAHELGHWMLKQLTGSTRQRRNTAPDLPSEHWCNEFASALLMPSSWLIEDLRRNRISGLPDSILSLPKKYNVSSEAFRFRVSSVTPVSVVEIYKSNGKVVVARRFQSTHVPEEIVSETIEKIGARLPSGSTPRRCDAAETRLLCVAKRLPGELLGSSWLVCMVPRATNKTFQQVQLPTLRNVKGYPVAGR
jgi:uncharacterized protein DUF955